MFAMIQILSHLYYDILTSQMECLKEMGLNPWKQFLILTIRTFEKILGLTEFHEYISNYSYI